MNQVTDNLNQACIAVRQGQVIAYPTEAVYGLGCDPFQAQAVQRVIALKQRSSMQGLIVLIAEWAQLFSLIAPLDDALLAPVQKTWPGPVTWVFPKSPNVPIGVSGEHATIAIRMTAHPVARALCAQGPLISTSANIHGRAPARSLAEVQAQFPQGIDVMVSGELGGASRPSAIYDVLTGECLRPNDSR